MKRLRPLLACAALLASAFAAPRAAAQGQLAPPAGAPAPTRKTLQQLWDAAAAADTHRAAAAVALQAGIAARHRTLAAARPGALAWQITTIDAEGDTGDMPSLAFGPDGRPAIAYHDRTAGSLRLAQHDGTQWNTLTIDDSGDVGAEPSLAFGPEGWPAIAYFDAGATSVKVARFDGAAWSLTTVVAGANFPSLAFGPDGQPALACVGQTTGWLLFARFDGAVWTVTTVEPTSWPWHYPSLAFAPDGRATIAFFDTVSGLSSHLKLARLDGAEWSLETIDPFPVLGDDTALAFGPDGQPAVAYLDLFYRQHQFARFDGTAWGVTTFFTPSTPPGDNPFVDPLREDFTDLAFGPDGRPVIARYDRAAGDLVFHRFDGTAWQLTVLDPTGDTGAHPSLAFGPDGQPAIAYRDVTNGDLKFARPGFWTP